MTTTNAALASAITEAFIAENPRQVVLIRRAKVATTAGGFTWGAPVNQAAQTFRKIEARVSGAVGDSKSTGDGDVIVPVFMLVCPLNANIQRDDRLFIDNKEYKVGKLHKRDLFGRTVAEVMEHA